jgi:hypothetical protein
VIFSRVAGNKRPHDGRARRGQATRDGYTSLTYGLRSDHSMSWLDIYLAVLVVALIGLVVYKLKS